MNEEIDATQKQRRARIQAAKNLARDTKALLDEKATPEHLQEAIRSLERMELDKVASEGRLRIATVVLGWYAAFITVIFIAIGALESLGFDNTALLHDRFVNIVQIGVLPILTLVLGYYFGSK